ncbi:tetratricopeptide repeat protein [Streptacidiphilus sp. 4-A2]|nr:tetratricopeptide repeat protein [Streptacidiphilus sp. 4-A2]
MLVQVSPLTYLPRLAQALLRLSYRPLPQTTLELVEEALATARQVDRSEPKREEILVSALNAYQRELYTLGRREAGFAVREEMAETGRLAHSAGRVASPAHGLDPLAAALAEEGRYAEAAAAYQRLVEAERADNNQYLQRGWNLINWAAALEAAGQHAAALDAFTELVADTRHRLQEDRVQLSTAVLQLIRLSQLLDAHGEHVQARGAREEVGTLLAELDRTGERRRWGFDHSLWVVLLAWSGRADEQPLPGEPTPPFGHHVSWSPDLRQSYLEGRSAIAAAVAELAPWHGPTPTACPN